MIKHHPTSQQLNAFVSGVCEPTLALMISAHTDLCAECQAKCLKLQHVETIDAFSSPVARTPELDKMFSRITQLPQQQKTLTADSPFEGSGLSHFDIELEGKRFVLPRTLKRYAKHTGNWSRLVGKLWQAPVDLGCMGKANFIYMEKGGKVPEHTHKGSEMTLVIDGQYGDGVANYDCGDFTLLDGTHNHLPHSEADEGCLVFTIVDKPLYFTSGIARLLNPFSHLFF
ncbi:ChrR family anti-sigma-E factor [Flavobacterium sp. W21_SRS_FM6]|uniref:ChrR family anti-sigma-E factor n=1 Tax=Flavobacterium sp. W21_SRS_FM6 TaxID=3240268 RepID=UPI003F92814E